MRAHFERQLPHMLRARTRARNAPRGAFLMRWRALVLPSLSAPSYGRLLATGSRCERQAAERCPARMPAPPGLPRRSTAQRSSCAWCLITASVEATCLRELTRGEREEGWSCRGLRCCALFAPAAWLARAPFSRRLSGALCCEVGALARVCLLRRLDRAAARD